MLVALADDHLVAEHVPEEPDDDPVKSSYSPIFDTPLTGVLDATQVRVVAWYDNEWGYSNRCVELAQKVLVRAHA